MKTDLFTSLSLVAFLLLSACSNEELLSETTLQYNVDFGDTKVTESTLSVTQALNNMNFVYRNFDKEQQKERRIKKVELIKSSNLRSTTRSENAEDMPLAYIVNFDNEAGYAILGADNRMAPVIVLGDEGNFSTEKYLEFLQKTETRAGYKIDFNNPEEVQYAMVTNGISTLDYTLVPTPPFFDHYDPRDTIMLAKIYPLVRTKWNQSAPYNHYVTEWGPYAGCVPVAVAQILTSLSYHKNELDWPDIVGSKTDSTYSINWVKILRASIDTASYTANQLTPSSLEVAKLLRAVGDNLSANYKPTGTGATSSNASALCTSLGLKNVQLINEFSTDDAFNMIVNNRTPMYLEAWDERENADDIGHAFVLDGWLQLGYTKDKLPTGGNLSDFENPQLIPVQYTFNLVHCNFGWGGKCDGYYTPGTFNASETEYDRYGEEDDNSAYTISYVFDVNMKEILYTL